MWPNVLKIYNQFFFRISADQVSFGTLLSCPESVCQFVPRDDQIFLAFSSYFRIGQWYAV